MSFKERIHYAIYNDDKIRVLKGRYKGQTGKVLRWLFADFYLVLIDISNTEIVVGTHLGELEPIDSRM